MDNSSSRNIPPVVMFMGPPGSGKGTQAHAVKERFHLARIETGAILRKAQEDPSSEGKKLAAIMDAGLLAPPPLVATIVAKEAERLLLEGQGVLFDGSPRTLFEAEYLMSILKQHGIQTSIVLFLDVPKEETVSRVLKRFICTHCKHPAPPTNDPALACTLCGGTYTRRTDDTADVMQRRWEEYTFRTLPVIHFFERTGRVVHIDGHRPIQTVTDDVFHLLEEQGIV